MADQVPDEVKEERNQVLLGLLEANSNRRNAALVGTTQEVLVEGPDRKGRRFTGRTRGNRVVHFAARPAGRRAGAGRIERASTAVLYGELALTGVES
jgi:tRNA-2-methylthio-N6-dimethylallyladenosine synthase